MQFLDEEASMKENTEIVQGYTIIESARVGDTIFVLGENPNAVNPYVVWTRDSDGQGYHWGHYFNTKADGIECLYAFALREARLHKDIDGLDHIDYRGEYVSDKLGDVLAYYRISDEDVSKFLDKSEVKNLKRMLMYKDMSMEDMKKVLGFERDTYPISYEPPNMKPQPEHER
jgi:hypothetical protein